VRRRTHEGPLEMGRPRVMVTAAWSDLASWDSLPPRSFNSPFLISCHPLHSHHGSLQPHSNHRPRAAEAQANGFAPPPPWPPPSMHGM
jgi:hypothetical protein